MEASSLAVTADTVGGTRRGGMVVVTVAVVVDSGSNDGVTAGVASADVDVPGEEIRRPYGERGGQSLQFQHRVSRQKHREARYNFASAIYRLFSSRLRGNTQVHYIEVTLARGN